MNLQMSSNICEVPDAQTLGINQIHVILATSVERLVDLHRRSHSTTLSLINHFETAIKRQMDISTHREDLALENGIAGKVRDDRVSEGSHMDAWKGKL